ncbi:hydroxysteroid dehydrogenase-like protein 3, partial [Leptotrombidium deliense]
VFIWSRIWKRDLTKLYGEYVVMTGATDGIGLALAKHFAERGHSLVIIGRNAQKLDTVKEKLETFLLPGRKIITVICDLSSLDSVSYKKIGNSLQEISGKIGILVNGAGVFLDKPDAYLNLREEQVLDNVKVNIAALLMVTREVLPFMVTNKKGIVVNIGSLGSLAPTPLMGVYAASKVFVDYFSSALRYEYKDVNVDVQIISPGMVSTRMTQWSSMGKPSLTTPTAEKFAISTIATIGLSSHTSGYWFHGFQSVLMSAMPKSLYYWLNVRTIEKIKK